VHERTTVRELCAGFDSVSACLSKGLGAPVGTVLLGNAAFVGRAKRARKILGGGMRQAGVLAAAGIFALENNIERLASDHENARLLAQALAAIDGVTVAPGGAQAQTNMVFINVEPQRALRLREYLKSQGMLISGQGSIRLVTHLDVERADIDRFAAAVREFFTAAAKAA
jgi:threonine aldolase